MRRIVLLSILALPASATAADAIERRLYTDQVTSSTFLWNDWNKFQENYHPAYAADGDPATAWVEGAKGAGSGEWIRFSVTKMEGATQARVRVHNGYQKSANLWKANARIKQATVTLYPSGATQTVTLADSQDWQDITVSQPAGTIEAIQLKVDSVCAGTKYEDLCLSDVELYVTATTRDNPVAENAKLTRLQAWKASRVAAAAAFKSSTRATMPIGQGYSLSTQKVELEFGERGEGTWAYARGLLAGFGAFPGDALLATPTTAIQKALQGLETDFSGWTAVQAVANDTRAIPEVDGLGPSRLWYCYEGPPVWGETATGKAHGTLELPVAGKVGFLRADGIGTFATEDAPSIQDALEAKPAACSKATSDNPKVYAWASMTPATATSPAHVSALLTVACGMVESREGYDRVAMPQLLVYDDAGRLSLLVGRYHATAFGWRGEGTSAVISSARRVSDLIIDATENKLVADQ